MSTLPSFYLMSNPHFLTAVVGPPGRLPPFPYQSIFPVRCGKTVTTAQLLRISNVTSQMYVSLQRFSSIFLLQGPSIIDVILLSPADSITNIVNNFNINGLFCIKVGT